MGHHAPHRIDRHPEDSLHDFAQLTFQTDQPFGALAGRMIDPGLTGRVPDPGRAIHHRPTTHGETLRHAGDSIVTQVFAASLAPLPPEQLAILDDLLAETDAQARARIAAEHLPPEINPDDLAVTLLAALQGGLLLAHVQHDTRALETALDTILALAL